MQIEVADWPTSLAPERAWFTSEDARLGKLSGG
jgi:hypothetical protein